MQGPVAVRLAQMLDSLSPLERTILIKRMWREKPPTLDEIGNQFAITKERVRQKQTDVKIKISTCLGEEGKTAATQLLEKLDVVVDFHEFKTKVAKLVPSASDEVQRILTRAMVELMPYRLVGNELVSFEALSYVPKIQHAAKKYADEAGLVNKDALLQLLPNDELRKHWSWFQQRCNFHECFGLLTLRNTRKANVKAAFRFLNRPASRPELAVLCGLTNKITSATLSAMREVVRVSRTHWALREWGPREYSGIVSEIVKRIERDGGATSVPQLIDELTNDFNVKRISVQAFFHTAKFQVKKGMVSIADFQELKFRDLNTVIHGRDDRNLPYWTFPIVARYFRGFSVVGVPVEIADHLGCPADGTSVLKIRNLPECRDLTIQWPLASTTSASIGYLRDALDSLGLAVGDTTRITILREGEVELTKHHAALNAG